MFNNVNRWGPYMTLQVGFLNLLSIDKPWVVLPEVKCLLYSRKYSRLTECFTDGRESFIRNYLDAKVSIMFLL